MSLGLVLKEGTAPVAPPAGYVRLFVDAADGSLYVQDSDGNTSKVINPSLAAADIPYDNSTSGLVATTVQAAIDELAP